MHSETRFGDTRTGRQQALDELETLTQSELDEDGEDFWSDDEVIIYVGEPKNEHEWRRLLDGLAEQAFHVDPADLADAVYPEIRSHYTSGSEAQHALNKFMDFPRNEHEWHDRVKFLRLFWQNPLQSLLDASPTLESYVNVGRRAHRSRSLKGRSELRREALTRQPADTESSESE